MMEIPKKERRFLKILGKVGEILLQELLIKVGKSLVQKIGGKKNLPSIIFLFISLSLFAQYPSTGNKQRLGFQTTGDGLVYRGRAADTVAIKSSGLNNAYFILDTVNNVQYNYIKTKGGWVFSNGDTIIINNNFTQPVDSLFFNVNVPTNNVDTAKMRWDSDLATVVLGLNDNVPNELGFKNFWLVKNQTGSTITKGSLVYANGTVGASGRITVAKFIANGTIDAKYLLGITAHDLSNDEDGYVISFGKIRQVNTDTFAAGAILYPSPTVAGVWTDVEPISPNIDMPIGFCINSHANNGTIAIRVASGYKLSELHDVAISSPVDKASLYYSGGLWRDTTAALLVSDTASMLTPYFRDADTTSLNLTSRFAAKLNLSDTASMLTNYLRTGIAASTYLTQSNAASTYLPLTGGTLTGGLNGTTGAFTSNLTIGNILSNEVKSISAYGLNNGTLVTSSGGSMLILYNLSGNINTFSTLSFYNKTSNGTIYPAAQIRGIKSSDQTSVLSGSLSFDLVDTTGNYQERLRLTNIGNFGIGTNTPSYKLDVNGTFNASGNSLIGGTLNVTSNITGNSFIKSGGTSSQFLKADGSVDNNAYLTTSSASSTYLPLTGGTLTGGLTGTTGTFTGLNVNNTTTEGIFSLQGYDNNTATRIQFKTGNIVRQEIIKPTSVSNLQFRSYPTGTAQGGYEFYVSNGSTESLAATIGTDKSLSLTGATTLSAPLTVNSSAVFNEGSADADFRVESDGNANMVFVDASTDRVGIGTNAPTKTLDVNGEVKIATTTATPTSLLGKDGSNVVGEVTTVAQTGLMKAGGTTANTSSVGIITVAHGLSYTPSQVIATVAQQNSYVIVCHSKDGTNMSFTVYDSVTGNALNNVSVGFFWLAIK